MTTIHSPLMTDQYELVMAAGYHQLGMAEKTSVFSLFFRTVPFENSYVVSAGLGRVIDYLNHYRFDETALSYLATMKAPNGALLFKEAFLHYLSELQFQCDVDAVSEGQIMFPHEPLLRIQGPLIQCQLLETILINLMQFSSVVATKAAQLCHVARGSQVVEFGLRRAQGPDGGLMASRAAYIGGCIGTSNVLAGALYGIPTLGTQAHSWIMAFEHELEAFESFARIMKHNAVLLVDTYDTLSGVKNAIKAGEYLRGWGSDLLAIRLDSGDLEQLSKAARTLLDEAGFTQTKIMASGDLSVEWIQELIAKGAPIDMWGVGTKLATASDHPYLNAAYKLSTIQDNQGTWIPKVKQSNTPEKTSLPGRLQVRRFYQADRPVGDIIYDIDSGLSKAIPTSDRSVDLLQPIFRKGQCVYKEPHLEQIRTQCMHYTAPFYESASKYSVRLDSQLDALKGTVAR